MKAEFEEKDFEAPLYTELRFGSHRIATPGQVFEGRFGIDAAIEAKNLIFWGLFGHYNIPKGVVLDHLRWGFMWRKLGRKRRLPTFNTNLLIQAKRPTPLSRASRLLKSYGFNSKHWRFEVTDHQQEILEKVSHNLRGKALVIYAAPAFHTLDDLYNHTEAQEVVENSNFVKVERLRNHKEWSYYLAGTSGVAHSEPEFIEDVSLSSMIEQMDSNSEGTESASENLRYLYGKTIEVCQEIQNHNSIAKHYLRLHGRLRRLDASYGIEETMHYSAFNLFCNVANLKWLVV